MLDLVARRPRADGRGDQAGRRAAGRGGAVGAVRPGAHLRQPLRVLLHLPAAPGPAEEPLPQGRRLPAELPLRELHHPHPVHRGRPRAGRHGAAEPAERVDPRHRSRGSHRDAPQPAGRHEPPLAAGPARPRHRGARPGRRVPRDERRRRCSTTRSPGCSTASPSWRRCAWSRSGSAGTTPRRGCAPTPSAEAAAVVDCVEDWQDVYLRVLGRRLVFVGDEYYLLAERPFPPADAYEGFAMHEDGVGMARTLEQELFGEKAEATGTQDGFFSWVDAVGLGRTRTTSPTAAPGPPPTSSSTCARRVGRRSGILSGTYGARVLAPLVARLDRDRRAGHPGREPVLRGHHRGHGPAGGGGPRPHPRRGARGPSLPAARRLPLERALPRRHRSRGPAPPRRGDRHRRSRAARGAGPATCERWRAPDDRPHRRRGRPAQRRQVHAGEPHRRLPGHDRGGEARRHARPQGGRRRVAGRALHAGRHRRLDAGRRLARRQGEPPERAGHPGRRRRDHGDGRHHRRHRGGQPGGGGDPQPGPRQGAPGRQQGRRRQPRGLDLGGPVARARATRSRSARCTAGAPATCSTA